MQLDQGRAPQYSARRLVTITDRFSRCTLDRVATTHEEFADRSLFLQAVE
jgi:hypothetical protein